MMIAGKGDELPVSALPVDGTFPTATARWENRDISMYVPAWEPDICIQCGNCSFVCPHSVIRAKFYNSRATAAGARGLPPRAHRRPRPSRCALHAAGLPRQLHRLRPVRRGLPGEEQGRNRAQGDQHAGQGRGARSRAQQCRVFRDPAVRRARAGGFFHGARRAVPATAVRVPGLLRGLRRNTLREAAVAAVRRPAGRCQRHRLLIHLWRQPADHAVEPERRGQGAGLVELAVRGQRRVRAWLPPHRRRTTGHRRAAAEGTGPAAGRGLRAGNPAGAADHGVRDPRPACPGRRPGGKTACHGLGNGAPPAVGVRSAGAPQRLAGRR